MSDNELDNLFKEAAEGFKAPHDPSAWNDMSGKLDQAAATTSTFWNWKTISTLTVMGVTCVALVWYLSTEDIDKPVTLEIASTQLNENKESQVDQPPVDKSTETNSTSDLVGKEEVNQKRRVDAREIKDNSKRAANSVTVGAKQKNNITITSGTSDHSLAKDNQNHNANVALNPEPNNAIVSDKLADQLTSNREGSNVRAESFSVVGDSLTKLDEDQKRVPAESTLADVAKEKPEENVKESGSRFAIKLAIAPDYTSVKSSTPDQLGISYGVLLEYRFSEHWSAATGGIWSKKIYTAYDVEYNGYNADWVDGDCRMWDIPVNVYYNFSPNRPFSIYAGLGFSSYLMNEENYVFYVETPYGTYDYPQQVKGENNEWFKTLNISMGMHLRLNNKFSLQLEPILKAPLTGVGEGEVSLVSLGAFFNLRFDIPINKPGRNDE